MINMPPFIFQKWLGPFTMLLFQGYSEAILFGYLSNRILNVRNFGNTLAMSVIFFFVCSKFDLDFKNGDKNWEKRFCFWDNCISIGCCKYCLLRAEYLSRAVNVLTNGLKVLHLTKSNFSKLSWLHSDQSIW